MDGILVYARKSNDVIMNMYDERLYFVNKKLGIPIYPSYDEIFIYENKRMMSYWLKFKEIPMPETYVFYDKDEALRFLDQRNDFPLIFKPNVGSAAIGIKFVKNKRQGKRLVNKMFTKWRFFNRGYTKWYMTKYKIPYPIMDDKQYNNVLFQEQIDIKY